VALKFAETTATGAGQRVFGVTADSDPIVENLDLFAETGPNTAFDVVLPVTASGGMLSLQFETDAGSEEGAKVNAIVVAAAQVLSPAAPTGLQATAASSSQIDLAWTDNSANETGFQIEVSTDGSNYALLTTAGANVTSYSHTGLSPSETRHYRVRACNSAGCSGATSANATTLGAPPAAPSNLSATAVGANRIDLSWADNSGNETGFAIERSTNGTTFTEVATVGANVTSYSDTGLSANTRYYHRVRAFNHLGSSAPSNTTNTRTRPK
jgi:hypothetical protein